MMVNREKVRALVYNRIISSPELIEFFALNNPSSNIEDFVWEAGSEVFPNEKRFPSIRYKIDSGVPVDCENCAPKTSFFLLLFIQSAQENSTESNNLMKLLSDLFLEENGSALGVFSESAEYDLMMDPEGTDPTDWSLEVFVVEQIGSDQFKSDDTPADLAITRIEREGQYWLSMLRFEMIIADR